MRWMHIDVERRVSENRVQEVHDKLNRTPRKRLGYRTPHETRYSETLHLM